MGTDSFTQRCYSPLLVFCVKQHCYLEKSQPCEGSSVVTASRGHSKVPSVVGLLYVAPFDSSTVMYKDSCCRLNNAS